MDEIGLPAEEGRRLQDVDDARHLGDVGFAVHVGQYRHADLGTNVVQDFQPAVDAGSAHRGAGAAVGLVVRCLENVVDAEPGADFLHVTGDIDAKLFRFGSARTGDQEKRLVKTSLESA
ncbi:hypothetical protein SDC9_180516 [bioreactor metagenome]|uniref:Uncharacterized protein n=1 Tax=bioreactor metagenome TaxID=1076179 RepID=A0A645HB62_9ZZZZ